MFLKQNALEFDRRNVSRTYLLLDSEAYELGEMRIDAYFSLAIKPLMFDSALSKSIIKKIDGFSKIAESVGAILIGQLGKCQKRNNAISGNVLLEHAFTQIHIAFEVVGCRVVFLECCPDNKLVSFYEQNGFSWLQRSENTGFVQMVRFL